MNIEQHFRFFFPTIRGWARKLTKTSMELDRFLDPCWIMFGTTPEAFQKSKLIQGNPDGLCVDRFLDGFLDRPLDCPL